MERLDWSGERHGFGGPGRFLLGRAEDAAERLMGEYAGRVRLIYLDPPFGTGDTFTVKARGKGKSVRVPAYEDNLGHEEYMAMMGRVLALCRELLTKDGSIYLHVDYRMAAYLKVLMDGIFGKRNFVNEIIWAYKSGGRAAKHFSRKHDDILLYRRGPGQYFNPGAVGSPRGPERRNHMKRQVDESGRVSYSIKSGGRVYTYSEDSMVYPSDVWQDIPHLHQRDPERTGYSTQKPEALLRRIIMASSQEGDIVADLFSGSGTTAAAAAGLGREWLAADASPAALMTLRTRLLSGHAVGGLTRPSQAMAIEYLAKPEEAPMPGISISRAGDRLTVIPDEGVSYLAAGRLEGGIFMPTAYRLSPIPGREVELKGAEAMHISDYYGRMTVLSC